MLWEIKLYGFKTKYLNWCDALVLLDSMFSCFYLRIIESSSISWLLDKMLHHFMSERPLNNLFAVVACHTLTLSMLLILRSPPEICVYYMQVFWGVFLEAFELCRTILCWVLDSYTISLSFSYQHISLTHAEMKGELSWLQCICIWARG